MDAYARVVTQEAKRLKDLGARLEEEVEATKTQAAQLQHKNTELRTEIAQIREESLDSVPLTELTNCQKEVQRLLVQNASFQSEITGFTTQVAELQEALSAKNAENGEFKQRMADMV